MTEQPLRPTPLRHRNRVRLRMPNHHALEHRRDPMSHAPIQPLVAEPLDRPALQRLHDVRIRGSCEHRGVLRAEREDRRAPCWGTDLAAERVHGPDRREGLERGERDAAERDGADGDARDDVEEVRVDARGRVERAEQRGAGKTHVGERGEGVGKWVGATAIRE